MRTGYKEKICYHIDLPAMQPDGSAMLFKFLCKQVEGENQAPTEAHVEVWMPKEIVESWVAMLPRIQSDMEAFEESANASKQ